MLGIGAGYGRRIKPPWGYSRATIRNPPFKYCFGQKIGVVQSLISSKPLVWGLRMQKFLH